MKNKTLVIGVAITTVVALTVLAAVYYMATNSEQAGRDKFVQAISELRTDKQYDNPCLGTSVLRGYTYTQLGQKTVEQIKELAKQHPGDC